LCFAGRILRVDLLADTVAGKYEGFKMKYKATAARPGFKSNLITFGHDTPANILCAVFSNPSIDFVLVVLYVALMIQMMLKEVLTSTEN